jgi:fatty acid desaturase
MKLRDAFRSDVRRAINATPGRRTASFGSMLVLVGLAMAFGSVGPWWVWPLLVILEGVVFLALGNHWAGKDALAIESLE